MATFLVLTPPGGKTRDSWMIWSRTTLMSATSPYSETKAVSVGKMASRV